MEEGGRKQILDFVKPLSVGLDGVTNFGDVGRILRACSAIAGDRTDVDPDRLFLLAVFSGQEKWVGKFGHGTRTELFLASVGVPGEEFRRLVRSLGRFRSDPRGPEEEIVHDAARLEELGAYGVARIVVEGSRERMDFRELAAAIEGDARDDFRTESGRALARPRISLMREFASRLRGELEEFDEPA
ncbi:MAG: hypothetical protein ACRD16_03230 [Thermoanaerobaculia bacterium]